MPRLCVIGHPVEHSLSPRIHAAALRELGLGDDWSYEAVDLPPERFEEGVGALRDRGFVGANITIPHKEAALALAAEASQAAREIGAANTLTFSDSGIRADNTDAEGLLASLPSQPSGRRALVVGAGGAGRAAAWALRSAGAEVAVWNRTTERADRVAQELGVQSVRGGLAPDRWQIVVNATTIGMERDAAAAFKRFPLDADQLTEDQTFVDLVYRPGGTELLHAAQAAGAQTVDGLEVLVRQGAASLRIWTGLTPPLEIMRRAAHEAR